MGNGIRKIESELLKALAKDAIKIEGDKRNFSDKEIQIFGDRAKRARDAGLVDEEQLRQAFEAVGLSVEKTAKPESKTEAKTEAPKSEESKATAAAAETAKDTPEQADAPEKKPMTQKELDKQFVKDLEKAEGTTPRQIKKSMVKNAETEEIRKYYESLPTDIDYLAAASKRAADNRRKELNGENVREELGVDENGNIDYKKVSNAKLMRKSFVAYTNTVIKEGQAPYGAIKKLTDKIKLYLKENNYDMTAVSDVIRKYASESDSTINGSEQGATEELGNVTRNLNKLMDLKGDDALTEEEAMRLADYCNIRVAVRESNIAKGLKHLAHDLGIGAVAGGVGSYVAASSAVNAFMADMTPEVWTDLTVIFKERVSQTVTVNGQEYVSQMVNNQNVLNLDIFSTKEDFIEACKDPSAYALEHSLEGAAVSAAISGVIAAAEILMNTLVGKKIPFEEAVHAETLAERQTDIDAYKKLLVEKYGTNASALIDVAEKHVVNGKLDWYAYVEELKEIGGYESVTNPVEQRGAQLFGSKTTPPTPIKDETPDESGTPKAFVKEVKEEDVTVPEQQTKTVQYKHERKYGDTWARIIKAYYPELAGNLYGKNGAIAALKKALAYDQDGTFNKEKYHRLLTDTNLPEEMLLPETLMNVAIKPDGKVIAATAKELGKGGSSDALKQVGRSYTKVTVTMVTRNGKSYWEATDAQTSDKAQGGNIDQAISNLQEKTKDPETGEKKKYEVIYKPEDQ